MNKYFYISKLIVKDSNGKSSEVAFSEGCNIICGPSNTGKTMIVDCIDFGFGSKKLKAVSNKTLNIDEIVLELTLNDATIISISRKTGKNSNIIHIETNSNGDNTTDMSYKKFTKHLLKYIGFENLPIIYRTKDYKTQDLTIRTAIGLSVINEERIISKESIFDNLKFNNITATLSAIQLFITGNPNTNVSNKDVKIEQAKKEAVTQYAHELIEIINKDELSDSAVSELESKIREFENKLPEQQKIVQNIFDEQLRNQTTYSQIYDELQKNKYRLERYDELENDYETDLQRAEFIIDGEKNTRSFSVAKTCPFCSAEMKDHSFRQYSKIAEAEECSIKSKLQSLRSVKESIAEEISELSAKLSEIEQRLSELQKSYLSESNKLNEIITQLSLYKEKMSSYESMDKIKKVLLTSAKECVPDTKQQVYDVKSQLTDTFFAQYAKYIEAMIKKCNYPGFSKVDFDIAKLDIIVDDEEKQAQGKGYRAYLNSIAAFSFLKYMSENAKHYIPFLILDSPLLSLKEVDESCSDSMKNGLFEYIINNQSCGQTIIVENDIPDLDYKNVNIIRFTGRENDGRIGFIV